MRPLGFMPFCLFPALSVSQCPKVLEIKASKSEKVSVILVEKINLIGEADADPKEDAPQDQHEHILGGTIERGADEERDPSAEHRPPAPEHPRHRRCEEGGDERRQVQ